MNFIPLLLFLITLACNSDATTKKQILTDTSPSTEDDSLRASMAAQKKRIMADMAKREITHLIISAPENKFGYYIMIDGQIYIEQKTIPAIEGNTGFATKADADKVALRVIEKIKQGELPPTISIEELKAMGIVF